MAVGKGEGKGHWTKSLPCLRPRTRGQTHRVSFFFFLIGLRERERNINLFHLFMYSLVDSCNPGVFVPCSNPLARVSFLILTTALQG